MAIIITKSILERTKCKVIIEDKTFGGDQGLLQRNQLSPITFNLVLVSMSLKEIPAGSSIRFLNLQPLSNRNDTKVI